MPLSKPQVWEVEATAHADAVAQFAAVARAIPASQWQAPLAPGKWSPAEITAHVTEVYVVVRREAAGGAGMRMRGSAFRRWLLRHLVLPRLLAGRSFPPGVRAPVETRPVTASADQASAIASLEQVSRQCLRELTDRQAAGAVWLTHAYFGRGPALYALRLMTVHLLHHLRQLPKAAAPLAAVG
jgi:hypothetical protein